MGGDLLRWLLKALQNSGLFRRNRFSLQVKVRAVRLYMAGLSYRDITYVLRVVPCSHETVRLWVKRLEQVAVNVKVKGGWWLLTRLSGGEWRYVWAAIEKRVDCWLYGFHGNNACGSLPKKSAFNVHKQVSIPL